MCDLNSIIIVFLVLIIIKRVRFVHMSWNVSLCRVIWITHSVVLCLTDVDPIVRSTFAVEYGWYKGLIKETSFYQITWHKRVKSMRHSWWINLIKSLALPISIRSRVTKVYAQHKRTATFSTRIRVYFKIP